MVELLLGQRGRIAINTTMILALVGGVMAFADLRASVHTLGDETAKITARLDQFEAREKDGASAIATRQDIQRLEARIDRLAELLAQTPTRAR